MRKRTILLVCIVMLALVFLTFFYFSNIDTSNFSGSNGLTTGQKCDAIFIGLTASDMGNMVLLNPGNFRVGPVSSLGSGGYNGITGYINTTDLLVQVPVTFNNGAAWFAQYYLVYVDLTKHNVMGTEFADAHHTPAFVQANIPPGTGWYHELGSNGLNNVNFQVIYDNGSPIIMPVFLDSENLQRALNGETYQTINVSLNVTPDQNMVNGSLHGNEDRYLLIQNDGENTTGTEIRFFQGY